MPLCLTLLTLDSSFLLLISLLTHPQSLVHHSPFLYSKLRWADNLVSHHNIGLVLQSSGIALLAHTKSWVPSQNNKNINSGGNIDTGISAFLDGKFGEP